MAICDHVRGRPRSCTVENADAASCNENFGKPKTLVVDLAINPRTGQPEPINTQPFLSEAEERLLLSGDSNFKLEMM